ncbi:unnamed protein product [Lactuca virosa]|uniref:Uncharacterized protein n=1 Tax=Lactuca virosa TaxID=75947 RepID=A0AAU9PRL1_9ASTR|nr:unnamed protein product [Lactuca virosa]
MVIRTIPTPVSPTSKKRHVEDVAKHISKKQKRPKKQRKLVLHEDSSDDEVVPDTPPTTTILGHSSRVRDSPVKSTFEETGNLDGNVTTSKVDTTINPGEQPKISTPK